MGPSFHHGQVRLITRARARKYFIHIAKLLTAKEGISTFASFKHFNGGQVHEFGINVSTRMSSSLGHTFLSKIYYLDILLLYIMLLSIYAKKGYF